MGRRLCLRRFRSQLPISLSHRPIAIGPWPPATLTPAMATGCAVWVPRLRGRLRSLALSGIRTFASFGGPGYYGRPFFAPRYISRSTSFFRPRFSYCPRIHVGPRFYAGPRYFRGNDIIWARSHLDIDLSGILDKPGAVDYARTTGGMISSKGGSATIASAVYQKGDPPPIPPLRPRPRPPPLPLPRRGESSEGVVAGRSNSICDALATILISTNASTTASR
jgi:hypothetical protein